MKTELQSERPEHDSKDHFEHGEPSEFRKKVLVLARYIRRHCAPKKILEISQKT